MEKKHRKCKFLYKKGKCSVAPFEHWPTNPCAYMGKYLECQFYTPMSKSCDEPGCDEPKYALNKCQKHYWQIKNLGKTIKTQRDFKKKLDELFEPGENWKVD